MTYEEAEEYLKQENKRRGMVLGLGTMQKLMKQLGNPQNALQCIHVAGTNGKGSVTAYLEQVLIQAGYKTGAYTSPAVFYRTEQYRVDGKPIDPETFAAGVEIVKEASDRCEMDSGVRPTGFEQETALAFWYFCREGTRMVVLETGLGGDEDATNIIEKPVCSVLTKISLDHWRILGPDTAAIAGHKAGIIKPGCPAVSWKQDPDAMEVIEEKCRTEKARLIISDPEKISGRVSENEPGQWISYREYTDVFTCQQALWQRENAAIALDTISVLRSRGYKITDLAVRQGFAQMQWGGRFEVRPGKPGMILDGAHNPDGAAALKQSIDFYFSDKRKVFVIGVLADKDYRSVIRILLKNEQEAVTVASDSARALSAQELAETVKQEYPGINVQNADSVKEGIRMAEEIAGEDGWIVICGSLSFMKDL